MEAVIQRSLVLANEPPFFPSLLALVHVHLGIILATQVIILLLSYSRACACIFTTLRRLKIHVSEITPRIPL